MWEMLNNVEQRWKSEKFCLQQEKNEMCFINNAKDLMEWIDKDIVCLKNMEYNMCAKNCE